jgi:hypothetical protein
MAFQFRSIAGFISMATALACAAPLAQSKTMVEVLAAAKASD